MRFKTLLSGLFLCLAIGAFASEPPVTETRLDPSDPLFEATGGGSVAHPFGTQAIRLNSAGFSGNGTFELSGSGGLAVGPEQALATGRVLFSGPPLPRRFAQSKSGQFSDQGFGFSGSASLSYTGNNIGLGVTSDHDVFMRTDEDVDSPQPLGHVISETALVAGLALPFSVGETSVSIGASVRPFIRVRGELRDPQAIEAFARGTSFQDAFADTPVLNGGGLAIDAGLLAEHEPFAVGFTIHNIGDTLVSYREHLLSEVLDAATQGRLPDGGTESGVLYDPDTDYVMPMSTRLGVAWNPGWSVIDPTVFADIHDPHLFGSEKFGDRGDYEPSESGDSGDSGDSRDRPPIFEHFSAGANLEVAGFLSLRAGASREGVGVGAGVAVGPLHIDSSMRVFGQQREHATVGVALRF